MKKIISIFISIVWLQYGFTQDTITFLHSWKQAVKVAQKNKKPIFLDAYTTWCAPCKRMAATTFRNAEVAKFFNEKFTCVKLNMERGEGINLARLYQIRVYPTLLFVNNEGKMMHVEAGFRDEKDVMETARKALSTTTSMAAQDAQFEKGEWDSDFLKNYIEQRAILNNATADNAIDTYLKMQSNWTNAESMDFIMSMVQNPGSPAFRFLLDKRELFTEKFGKSRVNAKIEGVVYEELSKGTHRAGIESMNLVLDFLYGKEAERLKAKYQTTFYRSVIEVEPYTLALNYYLNHYPPDDPAELADLAIGLAQLSKDKTQLKTILLSIEKSRKQEDTFECQLAAAYLHKALGKSKKAKKIANEAIVWAKENQENYLPGEQFLSTF